MIREIAFTPYCIVRGRRVLHLNVDIMASNMYSSYSKNMERRRQGEPTVRPSLATTRTVNVCPNERCGTGMGKESLLRFVNAFFMVESKLEYSEHWW